MISKFTRGRSVFVLLACAAMATIPLGMAPGEEPTAAVNCCGAQTEATPEQSDQKGNDQGEKVKEENAVPVCPQYVMMNFGSYCAYHALRGPEPCSPITYNSTNCSLPNVPATCPDGMGCVASRIESDRDPGAEGYGKQNSEAKKSKFKDPQKDVLKQDNATVVLIEDFVIKFKDDNKKSRYAQILIVHTTPDDLTIPPALFGHGIEIDEATPTHTYGKLVRVSPYRYRYQFGELPIDIIMHYLEP
jgi:hypothetical protein